MAIGTQCYLKAPDVALVVLGAIDAPDYMFNNSTASLEASLYSAL